MLPSLPLLLLFLLLTSTSSLVRECASAGSCTSCGDQLTPVSYDGAIASGYASGSNTRETGCKWKGDNSDCPSGYPIGKDSGSCAWGWNNYKCAACMPGYREMKQCLEASCEKWGITVWSTCENEQRCTPCMPGEVQPSHAQTACVACPAGKQSYGGKAGFTGEQFISGGSLTSMGELSATALVASKECITCKAGRYAEESSSLCDTCKGEPRTCARASNQGTSHAAMERASDTRHATDEDCVCAGVCA